MECSRAAIVSIEPIFVVDVGIGTDVASVLLEDVEACGAGAGGEAKPLDSKISN